MDNDNGRLERPNDSPAVNEADAEKKEWQEPKLTFVEPALTDHGALTSMTGQFFGGFSPPGDS